MPTTTLAKGLRLSNELWDQLNKLAKQDRRRLNEYIAIVLADHAKSKANKKVTG